MILQLVVKLEGKDFIKACMEVRYKLFDAELLFPEEVEEV